MMAEIKILVVEDESIIAEDIRASLMSMGYKVSSVVSTGEAAVENVKEHKPDIVLMDIMLQGEMDGIEAADEIRKHFNVPVVYLTAYSDEHILERAKITAPFGYIIKPFKEPELHITIEMALFKHKMEMKLKESMEFYENILERIVTGVWVTDKSDVIIYSNKSMEQIISGRIVGAQVIKDFQEYFVPYYLKAKESLQPFYYEAVPFATPKGTNYLSGWIIPKVKDGKYDGTICTIESIPKHAQVEYT